MKTVYENAVEFAGVSNQRRGLTATFGTLALFGGAVALLSVYEMLAAFTALHTEGRLGFIGGAALIGVSAALIFAAYCAVVLFTTAVRVDLYAVLDQPIVFDRRSKKVFRVFRETPTLKDCIAHPWRHLTAAWPVVAAAYEWSAVDFFRFDKTIAMGSVASSMHGLIASVRENGIEIDRFVLGDAMAMDEEGALTLFEFVRRYMEGKEGVPENAVRHASPRPVGWWHCLGEVSPIGPRWKRWLSEAPLSTCLLILLSPVVFPIVFLPWSIFNWLADETAVEVEWPDEQKNGWGRRLTA